LAKEESFGQTDWVAGNSTSERRQIVAPGNSLNISTGNNAFGVSRALSLKGIRLVLKYSKGSLHHREAAVPALPKRWFFAGSLVF
jgi:hypothetical protein